MQLIFISGSLRRSSLQVALLAGSRNTFTQTFVLFPHIDSSLVKLKNQSVTFTNGYATFSHESIKTTSIIIVQNVSGDGRGATAIIVDVNEVANYGSVTLKAYDTYSNKNYSGNQYLNILICN